MKTYVQKIIDYIENHVQETISIDDLSAHIGYSRYYLQRMFSSYLGFTVTDYIRKRKMQYAKRDLNLGKSVIDVAYDYGYDSERTFRRACHMVYHKPPSKLRKSDVFLPPKIILKEKGDQSMLSYLSDVKEVNIGQYYALGIKKVSGEPEFESINYMTEYKYKHHLIPKSEIGTDVYVTQEESDRGLRGYAQYLVISKDEYEKASQKDIIKINVKPSKYLMLTIEDPFNDPFERIPNGWKKLVEHVEPSYKHREDLELNCFEEKIETMHQTFMNIYIAIQ